jgi:hypothetical protein
MLNWLAIKHSAGFGQQRVIELCLVLMLICLFECQRGVNQRLKLVLECLERAVTRILFVGFGAKSYDIIIDTCWFQTDIYLEIIHLFNS